MCEAEINSINSSSNYLKNNSKLKNVLRKTPSLKLI